MTRRNLTTALITVAAGLLLFGGVALAREQATRGNHSVPAATQAAATLDDNGVDATRSPEIPAGDDHGNGLDDMPGASASPDDHGNGADETAEPAATADDQGNGSDDMPGASASPDDHGNGDQAKPSASPSFDDKTPKAAANPTSAIEDGGGHSSKG